MKDAVDSVVTGNSESEGFSNRKLIRPSLSRSEHARGDGGERRERSAGLRKAPPPEQTHAENFYYQKQMQSKTPMVVVLKDGEEIHGIIEWYDKRCLKVNRIGGLPNLLIYKPNIKYIFKASEAGNGNGR
ncbi:MAG: RNA chaperone Hfq [Acidobacteriota bacterium]|nr:RNA chaperone Hfq [Acidobacteriota bacterium]